MKPVIAHTAEHDTRNYDDLIESDVNNETFIAHTAEQDTCNYDDLIESDVNNETFYCPYSRARHTQL